METDWVYPEAQTPANARANKAKVANTLINFPGQPEVWKEKSRSRDKSGTSKPNPNITFMLRGRSKLGERLRRINANTKRAVT